jgi:hypothetical protein
MLSSDAESRGRNYKNMTQMPTQQIQKSAMIHNLMMQSDQPVNPLGDPPSGQPGVGDPNPDPDPYPVTDPIPDPNPNPNPVPTPTPDPSPEPGPFPTPPEPIPQFPPDVTF